VLLIVRLLDDATLIAMLNTATEAGLFSLVECFDGNDLDRLASMGPPDTEVLVGINTRDLATLGLRPERLDMVGRIPDGAIQVAESGMHTAEDAQHARKLGYRLALVGTALMRADDPAALVRSMIGS
jgi:indole-3-glycerol phosphate synthase